MRKVRIRRPGVNVTFEIATRGPTPYMYAGPAKLELITPTGPRDRSLLMEARRQVRPGWAAADAVRAITGDE